VAASLAVEPAGYESVAEQAGAWVVDSAESDSAGFAVATEESVAGSARFAG